MKTKNIAQNGYIFTIKLRRFLWLGLKKNYTYNKQLKQNFAKLVRICLPNKNRAVK